MKSLEDVAREVWWEWPGLAVFSFEEFLKVIQPIVDQVREECKSQPDPSV